MVSTLNVADLSETQELVKQAIAMAPVGGVFHLAMVLNDGLLTNMVLPDPIVYSVPPALKVPSSCGMKCRLLSLPS